MDRCRQNEPLLRPEIRRDFWLSALEGSVPFHLCPSRSRPAYITRVVPSSRRYIVSSRRKRRFIFQHRLYGFLVSVLFIVRLLLFIRHFAPLDNCRAERGRSAASGFNVCRIACRSGLTYASCTVAFSLLYSKLPLCMSMIRDNGITELLKSVHIEKTRFEGGDSVRAPVRSAASE